MYDNKQTIKNLQKSFIYSLSEYENSISINQQSGSLAKSSISNNDDIKNMNKITSVMLLSNEIHSTVNERTLEILFFKYFIGDLSINKIIYELYNKTM